MLLLHVKGSFVELDPDTDCIGSVTAFEYVILKGWIEAIEMGATPLMGAHDGPPTTVGAGVGAGGSTTSSTCDEEGPASM
jgi:hypothetical protein